MNQVKPKKKLGRARHNKNDETNFVFNISISNPKDFTNTEHKTVVIGNIAGALNYLTNYFTFVYYNHYKPILNNNNLKYLNNINPNVLLSASNKHVINDNSEAKSSLIDNALITSPAPYNINKLTEPSRLMEQEKERLSKLNKLSMLTDEQIDRMIELASNI
jgi:hypothetical protein